MATSTTIPSWPSQVCPPPPALYDVSSSLTPTPCSLSLSFGATSAELGAQCPAGDRSQPGAQPAPAHLRLRHLHDPHALAQLPQRVPPPAVRRLRQAQHRRAPARPQPTLGYQLEPH